MKNEQPTVLVLFEAKAGYEEKAREVLRELVRKSLRDEGCLQYDMHEKPDAPGRFMLFERWASRKLLSEHQEKEWMAEHGKKIAEVMAAEPEISFWTPFPGS